MRISKSSAQQIVEEIGKLVRQNINLMDETGCIVASNDPERIGNFHEGAYQIITRHLKELYITPELERAIPMVRRGINLPIEVDGQVEGVIGITGAYDEVISYGQIVKKMAEILIRERIILDAQRYDLRVRSRFLEDWILGEGLSSAQALSERGFAIGIDIRIPRRCLVLSVDHPERYTGTLEGQQFIERLETAVNEFVARFQSSIVLRNAARQIVLLPRRSTEELTEICRELTASVGAQFDTPLRVGIDGAAEDIHAAYLQANRAWRAASHSKESIVSYETLSTELLLDHIPRKVKADYLRKLYPGCSAAQLREFTVLLEAYFAAEGSLNAAADVLFVHKNTLQYRLKRLAEITGLDVRKPSNAPALYMAVLFFRDLENEEELLL